MNDYLKLLNILTPAELGVLRTHQMRIRTGDRQQRQRARKEFRRWLDYLMYADRITPQPRDKMDYMDVPKHF